MSKVLLLRWRRRRTSICCGTSVSMAHTSPRIELAYLAVVVVPVGSSGVVEVLDRTHHLEARIHIVVGAEE